MAIIYMTYLYQKSILQAIITDRVFIKAVAEANAAENDAFRDYLRQEEGDELDAKVFRINEQVTAEVDCTKCGACCRQLMINVTKNENISVANHLGTTPEHFKERYLEQSMQGKLIMNTIPCHFLSDSKCTIYRERFTECRGFPHLHESNFKGRLFGTLIHYAMCPIIFNVVEELKVETGFKIEN